MNDDPKDTTAQAGGLGDAAATATDTSATPAAGTVMPPAAPGDGGTSPMGGAPVTPGLPVDTTAPGAEAPAAEGGLPVTAPGADTPATTPGLPVTPASEGTTDDGK